MKRTRTLVTIACPLLLLACGDSTGPSVGPPAVIRVLQGDNQAAPAGTVVPQPIRLRVEDAQGRGVADVVVTFTVTSGFGQISQSTGTTDAAGEVEVPAWTLGKYDLPQRVTASVSAGAMVTVEIAARVATQYQVDLVFLGPPMTQTQRTAVENAAARIQAMITGDVFDVSVDQLSVQDCLPDRAAFFGVRHTGVIDDLVIYASIDSIDGPGGTLAFAGACYFRLEPPGSANVEAPLLSIMVLDSADVRGASAGQLEVTAIHEMLHAAGFSSGFWNRRNLVANSETPNWSFTGTQARLQCEALGGAGVLCNPFVPIEAQGRVGTRGSHWRECELPTLGREMMTGFLSVGDNPLSAITIGSMGDLGYQVNVAAADPFPIPTQTPLPSTFEGCFPPSSSTSGSATHQWEKLITPIAGIDRSGRMIRLQEEP